MKTSASFLFIALLSTNGALVGCSADDGLSGTTSDEARSGEPDAGLEGSGGSGGSQLGAGGTVQGGGGTSGSGGGVSGSSDAGGVTIGVDAGDAGPRRVPTPPRNGTQYPFPQNRESGRCSYPNYKNEDVEKVYAKWKADLVTSDGARGFRRVKRSSTEPMPNDTVSEGIAYGMMAAVYMADQALFDDLWKYEQNFLAGSGLMHWHISASGNVAQQGAATDADEDMAWALLMADKQWGGKGSLGDTYLNIAKQQIDRIWRSEVLDGKLIKLGDTWGDWNGLNISYFAPSYYRVFATVDPGHNWNEVIKTSYDIIDSNLAGTNGQSTGLVRGFSDSKGNPFGQMGGKYSNYNYDACRVPFRIALDWCLNGETRARDYVAKTSSFFSGIGVKQIRDGYEVNGKPAPENANGQSAAFIGPAGIGAMHDANFSRFVQDAYDAVARMDMVVGGIYYDESWMVLSLLMMSGNFLDYTLIK